MLFGEAEAVAFAKDFDVDSVEDMRLSPWDAGFYFESCEKKHLPQTSPETDAVKNKLVEAITIH